MAAAAAARAMVLCVVLCCWLLGLPARRRPAALRRNQLSGGRAGSRGRILRARPPTMAASLGKPHEMCAWSRDAPGPCLPSEARRPRASYETVPYGFDKKLSSAHKQNAAHAVVATHPSREKPGRHLHDRTGR